MALSGQGQGRPRLLVLRALGLGDLLTGVPALRALHRGFPQHELVLATPRTWGPLLRLADLPVTLLDASGLEPLDWSGAPPVLAVNLHGRGPQSHRLLASLEPRRLVGFDSPEAGHAGPPWRQDEHEVHRWCRLVAEGLGLPADPADLRLSSPAQATPAPGAVVVHPGAAFPSRRWPPERFAEVARWAGGAGHEVVLTGSSSEALVAEEVRRLAGLPAEAVLAGRTDLAELAALVADARLVVCGDTGVAHLASAFGTPSVVLFGPVPPARWGPPEGGPHVALWHGTGEGDPWGDAVDPALCVVEPAEVVAAAERLLSGGCARRPDGPAGDRERSSRRPGRGAASCQPG